MGSYEVAGKSSVKAENNQMALVDTIFVSA